MLEPGRNLAAWIDSVLIPGTKRRSYLEENVAAADIKLDATETLGLEMALTARTYRYVGEGDQEEEVQ